MKKTQKNYKIMKILNNSSLIVNDTFFEIVFIGKGIAFGLKNNDELPAGTSYERKYQSPISRSQFSHIISGYQDKIIEMVMDTIRYILKYDGNRLEQQDLIYISDHLAAAYTRILNGEAIDSFFSYEIKALYPDSYEIAGRISNRISTLYGISIPMAETSYIALHIQNLTSKTAKENIEVMNVIVREVSDLLHQEFKEEFDYESLNYSRFITHLRFLIEGLINNKQPLSNDVTDALIKGYPHHAEVAKNIAQIISNELNLKVPEEEIFYLLIHVINVSAAQSKPSGS